MLCGTQTAARSNQLRHCSCLDAAKTPNAASTTYDWSRGHHESVSTSRYAGARSGCLSSAMCASSKSHRNVVWCSHRPRVMACKKNPHASFGLLTRSASKGANTAGSIADCIARSSHLRVAAELLFPKAVVCDSESDVMLCTMLFYDSWCMPLHPNHKV
jgi:hypothetical protein